MTIIKQETRALTLTTGAMMGGAICFTGISILVYIANGKFINDAMISGIFFVALVVLTAVGLTMAASIYKKHVASLKAWLLSDREKLEGFRSITLAHFAICEILCVVSVLLFFVFGEFMFFIPLAFSLAEMFRKFPGRGKIEALLNPAFK